ncbi:MAG: undecaprenyl-diphosphatase UppP [Chloroflexi bacterium]|nr:undecaprenyl-diphosphatase UppP [Chloroflexota bacterium]
MTLIQSILLGIVQGLTEFLPISSSAHLVLVPYLFGWKIPAQEAFIFDVLVQDGTLLAVIVYFRKDLLRIITAFINGLVRRQPFAEPDARLGWYLILATVPAGIFGVTIKNTIEAAFSDPAATALLLVATGLFLFLAERFSRRSRKMEALNWKDALWIGVAQAVAVFPGISRSGATISGGMARNLERVSAGRFAFLMSVPVMLAAGLLAGLDLLKTPSAGSFMLLVLAGFLTAAVVGYFSIHWLLRFLTRRPLYIFAIYCVVLGLGIFIFSLL